MCIYEAFNKNVSTIVLGGISLIIFLKNKLIRNSKCWRLSLWGCISVCISASLQLHASADAEGRISGVHVSYSFTIKLQVSGFLDYQAVVSFHKLSIG